MIIDASNLLLGRMATHVAKEILNGENVEIVNCEKAIISGSRRNIIEKYSARTKRGTPFHGPFYPRREEMVVRRAVRGMLPFKEIRGQDAFRRLKCYTGLPESLKEKKLETIKEASVSRLGKAGYVTIADISKEMGKKNAR